MTGPVIVTRPLTLERHQSGRTQHSQVLRYGRLSDAHVGCKLTDSVAALPEPLVQATTRRIGECGEHITISHDLY